MSNPIFHEVTITGPAADLERFAACWALPAKGECFPPIVVDKLNLKDAARPEGELFFDFDRLSPKPDDSDNWVLSRVGIVNIAYAARLEAKDGAIKFTFQSRLIDTREIFIELAELFPTLMMKGWVSDPMAGIGGDVLVADGVFTFTDKSAKTEAQLEAFRMGRRFAHTVTSNV